MNININDIKKLVQSRNIIWTKHCLNRLNQRNILISDVKHAINNGYVIENYKNDYPFPSCLILGKTQNNKNLHIVCSVNHSFLYLITVYFPDNIHWSYDFKRRKK